MARICCVESCRAVPQDDITFFNFPIKQSLQKKWKEAIRPTKALTVESVICSRHFAARDYETVRGRVRLKARVVPTMFDHSDSPNPNPPKGEENPKENGHSKSPNTLDRNEANDGRETVKINSKDVSRSTEGESCVEEGSGEDGQEDSHGEYEVPVELNCEVQLTEGEENETIECVPEALLHEDSDSHSEADIHKEDIEDIIANYHIKQDPKLAERLKASQEKENLSNNQDSKSDKSVIDKSGKGTNNSGKEISNSGKQSSNSGKEINNSGKQSSNSGKENKNSGKNHSSPQDDNDCVEVSYQPSRQRRKPKYIEIPVDEGPADEASDCLMVLESVQVDVDPAALLHTGPALSRDEPISLLTSSDDDDVIVEEPHIDTVEVSDETDEDDVPLTRLLKAVDPPYSSKVRKILWGKLSEYYCYECQYVTTAHADFAQHRLQHENEKIFHVCDVCEFSTASKSQFVRHKRKHKDGKNFNCHLCDYKAKHHMSLIYHLKSHGVDEMAAKLTLGVQKSKCPNCNSYFANTEFVNHCRRCRGLAKHKCTKCKYVTRRSSDLKRHVIKKHLRKRKRSDDEEDDDDYEA